MNGLKEIKFGDVPQLPFGEDLAILTNRKDLGALACVYATDSGGDDEVIDSQVDDADPNTNDMPDANPDIRGIINLN